MLAESTRLPLVQFRKDILGKALFPDGFAQARQEVELRIRHLLFGRVLSASVHEAVVGEEVDCRSILLREDDRCGGNSQYERNRA
jgi:hypothetical protein